MNKRRLSAIPRDEATTDMLDIAGRLEGMHHIVTARLVEENKILLLNFYEVSKLKKGKTEAAFRTFLSKDDYITQDLKESKVKWRTSSFFMMDEICIRLWMYNSGNSKYEYKTFINSTEEENLIREFFSKYKEAEDESAWESVFRFQEAVKEARLNEKHRKELEKVDAAMEPFKEPPPHEFFDWVWETGMRFARYVIYKETTKGKAECECTHCGKAGEVSRKEFRLRNNEKGVCPFCGSRVTYKARGKLASQTMDERWVIYVHPTKEGFTLRYFKACRTLRSDTFIKGALYKTRLEEYIHELSRSIYTFPKGVPKSVDYEWNVYKQRGKPRWCPFKDKWACAETILYPGNLPAAWSHTPLKYSALEVLANNIPTVALNYERGIGRYIEFPKLEWLCKMGLNNLAKHVINKGHRSYGSLGKINYSGKTIYSILGLTKVNTRIMQEIDGTNAELRLLQVAQQIGMQFRAGQLREYYQTFECNTDLLKATKGKVTLHKLVKYIGKESQNYPMGERGGCWMYSYNRYHEREDPRIERKRNTAHDWLEYLKWCQELKYDLDNMFIYMPKNFKKVHDRTAKEYQEMRDKKAAAEKRRREREAAKRMAQTKKAMEEIFAKSDGVDAFSVRGKGLILIVPQSGAEIKAEGEALHHCVGGYVGRVARGETNIFFIRKADAPDKSYYTMEWRDNRIIQCRGKSNCAMTPEVEAFTKVFEKKMLEKIKEGKTDGKRKKQNIQSA